MKLPLLLLLTALPLAAQTQPANGPKKITIYLAADGSQLPGAEGADHRADISLRDSVSGTVKEYFPSGKLRRMASYAHVPRGIRHGVEMTYDEGGTLRRRQEFVAGQRQGELQLLDKEGKVSRKVVYSNDQRVSQECYSATGAPKACADEKVLPEFPGGTNGLIRAITQATVMSADDVARNSYGIVDVKFVVDKNSQIVGAVVLKAPTPTMGQAVVKALSKISFSASGLVDGQPTAVVYTIPVELGYSANPWARRDASEKNEHRASTVFLPETE